MWGYDVYRQSHYIHWVKYCLILTVQSVTENSLLSDPCGGLGHKSKCLWLWHSGSGSTPSNVIFGLWEYSQYYYRLRHKTSRFFHWCITSLKNLLWIKVGWVLKNSGNSLDDGHWDFSIWTRESWENWVWSNVPYFEKSSPEPPFTYMMSHKNGAHVWRAKTPSFF